MSRIAQHLAGGLDVRTSTRIASMQRRSDGWFLLSEEAERTGPFSHVIVTVPGPQAAALLPAQTECHAVAQRLKYAPCWAVMARFAEPVSLPYDGVVLDGHPLRWIARDSSKPERASGERWVLHATPHWSENTIEQTPDHVAQQARVFTQTLLGARPVELVAHRWRYALSLQTDTPEGIYEPEHGLALCGDGMGQARVEGAFMSGLRMATRLLSTSC